MRHLFSFSAALLAVLTASQSAKADELKIVTTIAPLHSLITQVTGDLAEVSFLVKGAESPHGFSLKPSDRLRLAEADFVFLIDPLFEMSLAKAADGDSRFFSYTSAPELRLLPYRHQDDFMMAQMDEHHDEHGHDEHHDEHRHDEHHDEHGHEDHHDEHGHDEHHDEHGHDEHHDEHGHDEHHDEHGHDEHGHDEHHDEHGHDHHDHSDSIHDLHIWLDPENAKAILAYTAQILGEGDPANAALYSANATAAIADITTWSAALSEELSEVHASGFVTYHDAFQYLEFAYDVPVLGTILDGHATQATAATLAQLQHLIEEGQVSCLFQEPQFEALSLEALDSHGAVATAQLDPLGSDLTPGPQLYQQLMTGMADEIAHCSEDGGHHHH